MKKCVSFKFNTSYFGCFLQTFISSAESSMGEYFAQKQAHMVTCTEDVFQQWMEIIKDVEQGSIPGKKTKSNSF